MTVWIVNPFDTLPAEGHRPLRYWLMAQAFARSGHDVVYWTADFNHVQKRPRNLGTLPENPENPENPGPVPTQTGPVPIQVIAVHEPPYTKNISLKRLWAHWRWAKNWHRAAAKFIGDRPQKYGDTPQKCGDRPFSCGECPHRPGLIVVSSPPLSICKEVEKFAKKYNSKVIIDVMDAWPETFERVVPRRLLWPLRRIVRANYLGADAITTVADNYIKIVQEYGFSGNISRFYHGIELGTGPNSAGSVPRENAGTGPKNVGTGPVKIVYAGNLGATYDIATAMEAVGLLEGATLEIAGAGDCEAALREFGDSPQCRGRVKFRGYLDEAELAAFLAAGDIGLVPMAPDSRVGVPYKFADYARAGLAILSSLGGESDRLLARYGAGAAYRAGDAQSLAATVRRLMPRLAEAKAAARRLAEAEFDAAKIYSGYVAFATAI